ncbi:MAG: (d)CMP kinase [Clostridia bacterium]|nr:(d)CMP kinase [Clostridia bacterium]
MKRIVQKIEELLAERDRVVVTIDGPCASGKTTLAKKLAETFDCNLIHMDDFFLRPEQRTPERLDEPGGNVDRERFWDEVMNSIVRYDGISYRPYLCSKGELGEPIFLPFKQLCIIEGSYSQHPFFGKTTVNLRVFLDISPEKQRERLKLRDPEKLERFLAEWIPMEQRYFETFHIREQADLCLEL